MVELKIAASFQQLSLNPANMTTAILPKSPKRQKLIIPALTPSVPSHASSRPPSPFDALSDEIVLKIIRMAAESHSHQDFLVDVIAKVSFRFSRLAADASLWDLHVGITFGGDDEPRLKDVVYGFLNEGTNYLALWNDRDPSGPATAMSAIYIYAVAARCPNLMAWYISGMRMDAWPTLKAPWASLEDLWLEGVQMKWNAFRDVDIHINVPNLKVFGMKSCHPVPKRKPILLPDFGLLRSLQAIRLVQGTFSFPATLSPVPLPRDLKKLCILHGAAIVNFDQAAVEKHFRHCNIDMT